MFGQILDTLIENTPRFAFFLGTYISTISINIIYIVLVKFQDRLTGHYSTITSFMGRKL
jgi:hypothetical protein